MSPGAEDVRREEAAADEEPDAAEKSHWATVRAHLLPAQRNLFKRTLLLFVASGRIKRLQCPFSVASREWFWHICLVWPDSVSVNKATNTHRFCVSDSCRSSLAVVFSAGHVLGVMSGSGFLQKSC